MPLHTRGRGCRGSRSFGYVLLAVAGAIAVVAAVHLLWRLDGIRRIRRAGPRLLLATRHRIWREPTLADLSDLRFGPGGAEGVPQPPFQFVTEHFTGSQPCVAVRDAAGRLWRVKWGYEAKPESFAVRFAWALGYFAEVTHFVPSGAIAEAVESAAGAGLHRRQTAPSARRASSSRIRRSACTSTSTAGRGTTTRSSARRSSMA